MLTNCEHIQTINEPKVTINKNEIYENLVNDCITMGLVKENILECDPKTIRSAIKKARKENPEIVKRNQALLDYYKGVKAGTIDPKITKPPVKKPKKTKIETINDFNDDPMRNVVGGDACKFNYSENEDAKNFVKSIENPEIERDNEGRIASSEVLGYKYKTPKKLTPKKHLSESEILEKLKNTSLEVWIVMACRVYKGLSSLIASQDIDFKRIVFSSAKLNEKGMTTIRQLETLSQIRLIKDQYINLYLLNKMWANLLTTKEEQEVFRVVMQRAVKESSEKTQKARTAYRLRRQMIKKFKEFCLVKGYDQEWFYDHFAILPPFRYFAEKCNIEKSVEEVRLNGEV